MKSEKYNTNIVNDVLRRQKYIERYEFKKVNYANSDSGFTSNTLNFTEIWLSFLTALKIAYVAFGRIVLHGKVGCVLLIVLFPQRKDINHEIVSMNKDPASK